MDESGGRIIHQTVFYASGWNHQIGYFECRFHFNREKSLSIEKESTILIKDYLFGTFKAAAFYTQGSNKASLYCRVSCWQTYAVLRNHICGTAVLNSSIKVQIEKQEANLWKEK